MEINYNKVIDLYETVIIKIFEYIKTEKWELLEKTIRDNKDLDYNVKDNSNTYILEYAIIFNKINIVKLLLSYDNMRIDIINDNSFSDDQLADIAKAITDKKANPSKTNI